MERVPVSNFMLWGFGISIILLVFLTIFLIFSLSYDWGILRGGEFPSTFKTGTITAFTAIAIIVSLVVLGINIALFLRSRVSEVILPKVSPFKKTRERIARRYDEFRDKTAARLAGLRTIKDPLGNKVVRKIKGPLYRNIDDPNDYYNCDKRDCNPTSDEDFIMKYYPDYKRYDLY